MPRNKFRRGVPYTTCERTGRVLPYSETVVEWTGLRVDKRVADPRHPQDFVRVKKEKTLLRDQKYIVDTIEQNEFNQWFVTESGDLLVTQSGDILEVN